MSNKFDYLKTIDDASARICKLSDDIWDNPETAFAETESTRLQCEALRELGFEVTENLGGIATAFSGRFGHGKPVIGFLGEFDALSGLSQESEVAVHTPIKSGAPGHGCGHNLLGAGSIGAAVAVKNYLEQTGKEGTVIYFGCPGEEGGSGKAFMAREGVFDELDLCITWHPGIQNAVRTGSSNANQQLYYRFSGLASHAAGSPELGRSALDAVELMNVGVQFLREHVISSARIHYAITDTGGYSPNVVQPTAEVLYLVRAPQNKLAAEIRERVDDIARGAALMTGTKLEIDFVKACSNTIPNLVIEKKLQENMDAIPLPPLTDEDMKLAEAVYECVAPEARPKNILEQAAAIYGRDAAKKYADWADKPLLNFVLPLSPKEEQGFGSTDVGDVSWVCPTAQISTATWVSDTPGHSWQVVCQGKSDYAHKAAIFASKVMAATAIDFFEDEKLIEEAKAEHAERIDHGKYECPIPAGVKPRSIGMKK